MKTALSFFLAFSTPLAVKAAEAAAVQRPNIVFILADDIGYGDFGCYGSRAIPTPNVDRLAAQGLRFTDVHSPSAMCTPTRYGIMTGRYAWRSPTGCTVLLGDDPLCIPLDCPTLPRTLQAAGYATGAVGKWHLGLGMPAPDFNAELKPGPREVGFDYSFIMPGTGDRVPCVYVENERVVGLDPNDPIQITERRQHHELMGSKRIGKMTGGTAALWKDEDMADVFTSKAVRFIEEHQSGPFFLYLATHDCHNPTRPNERFRGKSKIGARGDAVVSFDWTVGQVMETLERLHLADRTVLIVTSDNGGYQVHGIRFQHPTNGPLRGYKQDLYEGGHRVPFILRWPGQAPAGQTSGAMFCLADMLATFADLAGARHPPAPGLDSVDVKEAFLGHPSPRAELVMHDGHSRTGVAIRRGPWVLIPAGKLDSTEVAKGDQLFNVVQDLGEMHNVAADHPDLVIELRKLLIQIRAKNSRNPPE
jgi:arylsulfatase A-like enzyme